MAPTGKLMSVKEEQALVLRERNLYKINAEDWELNNTLMEVETHLKAPYVSAKFISFGVEDGKLVGGLILTLAQSVDPGTVWARFAMAVRRRGAAAVTRLEDELCAELELDDTDGVVICPEVFLDEDVAYNVEAFFNKHLVDGQLLIEVDLEVAVRKEQLGKAVVLRRADRQPLGPPRLQAGLRGGGVPLPQGGPGGEVPGGGQGAGPGGAPGEERQGGLAGPGLPTCRRQGPARLHLHRRGARDGGGGHGGGDAQARRLL